MRSDGDDDDVGVLAVTVVTVAHLDVPVLEFAAVIEIMAFAERLAGGMIDEYELVAQTMGDDGERRGGSDLPGADDDDFVPVHGDHVRCSSNDIR